MLEMPHSRKKCFWNRQQCLWMQPLEPACVSRLLTLGSAAEQGVKVLLQCSVGKGRDLQHPSLPLMAGILPGEDGRSF